MTTEEQQRTNDGSSSASDSTHNTSQVVNSQVALPQESLNPLKRKRELQTGSSPDLEPSSSDASGSTVAPRQQLPADVSLRIKICEAVSAVELLGRPGLGALELLPSLLSHEEMNTVRAACALLARPRATLIARRLNAEATALRVSLNSRSKHAQQRQEVRLSGQGEIGFSQLGPAIHGMIVAKLPLKDMLELRMVCKDLRDAVSVPFRRGLQLVTHSVVRHWDTVMCSIRNVGKPVPKAIARELASNELEISSFAWNSMCFIRGVKWRVEGAIESHLLKATSELVPCVGDTAISKAISTTCAEIEASLLLPKSIRLSRTASIVEDMRNAFEDPARWRVVSHIVRRAFANNETTFATSALLDDIRVKTPHFSEERLRSVLEQLEAEECLVCDGPMVVISD
uniref:F-box domain-containing protein n=1 Tax=Chrysotila carterae TaxID=13221 RepID=A0A7S4B8K5_CHRCT|mmetsp:Transcript_25091/g.48733  ORF Transcript_25091/g.48733 Transcript_25091/m.48733 type:complete len:400 (-) Transcript_25091:179-1378(-)|eukprot:6202754-Pleurochrysis_carterae.AAC.1